MKLGAAYNVFDGIEIFVNSVKSIRRSVDYICVVYQTKSNFGNEISTDLMSFLHDCMVEGLIDDYQEYEPFLNQTPHQNECNKRNIGLEKCRDMGCTHYMTIDVDEIYIEKEFKKAKQLIIEGDFDSSACQMQTYYKTPEHALTPPEDYYVPFIYRIDDRRFGQFIKWPVIADPTRKLIPNAIKIFEREELQMHHLSYVRNDIMLKLNNSSAKRNFQQRINIIADHYNSWREGDQALLAGKEERYYDLKKVNYLDYDTSNLKYYVEKSE